MVGLRDCLPVGDERSNIEDDLKAHVEVAEVAPPAASCACALTKWNA